MSLNGLNRDKESHMILILSMQRGCVCALCSEHLLVKTQIKGDSHDSDAHH